MPPLLRYLALARERCSSGVLPLSVCGNVHNFHPMSISTHMHTLEVFSYILPHRDDVFSLLCRLAGRLQANTRTEITD